MGRLRREVGSAGRVALPFFGLAGWVWRFSLHGMEIGRKKLPHEMPPGVVPNPEFEVYFITICCEPRGRNQLVRMLLENPYR